MIPLPLLSRRPADPCRLSNDMLLPHEFVGRSARRNVRVSVFDPRLNAGAYITKDLARSNDSSTMKGFHVSGKVSWGDCQLTLANSVPPSPSRLRRGKLESGCKPAAPAGDPHKAIGRN